MLQPFPFRRLFTLRTVLFLFVFQEILGIACVCGFQCELELTVLPFHTTHNDLTRMHIDHCPHNAQAQTYSRLIHAAGLIGLVETVKDMGYLFLAQTRTGILDPD